MGVTRSLQHALVEVKRRAGARRLAEHDTLQRRRRWRRQTRVNLHERCRQQNPERLGPSECRGCADTRFGRPVALSCVRVWTPMQLVKVPVCKWQRRDRSRQVLPVVPAATRAFDERRAAPNNELPVGQGRRLPRCSPERSHPREHCRPLGARGQLRRALLLD